MKLKYYYNLLTGKTDASNPAKLTWGNIKGVLQAWLRKSKRNISGFDLEDHLYEQIIWRRTEVKELSPRCWKDGVCKVCGCEVLGKTMEDRPCEGHCYPSMMDAETWKEYKTIHKIKLFE